jgi:hypothetical protein
MCTGTPRDARAAAERVAGLGADYLDAGLQASPATIGTDAATILYSGSRRAYERHVTEFAGTAGTPLGHVVTAVPDTVAELRQGTYPPGPADLTGHLTVVRHLIELRTGQRLGDAGLAAVAARMEALIADGRGAEG